MVEGASTSASFAFRSDQSSLFLRLGGFLVLVLRASRSFKLTKRFIAILSASQSAIMRFSTPFIVLSAAYMFPSATAANSMAGQAGADDVYDLGVLQEQLPIGDVAPAIRTRTVTETQTFLEVVETVYVTKRQLVPTWIAVSQEVNGETGSHDSSPTQPQEEVKDEAAGKCDDTKEISCAVCRTIHQCGEFEEGW